MAGLGDLLKLATMAPIGGDPSGGGLMAQMQGAASVLERMTAALEALVQIEAPFTTNASYNFPANSGPFAGNDDGSRRTFPFLSRAVVVYCPNSSPNPFLIQFLDLNRQTAAFPGIHTISPGDFRSFAVSAGGFIVFSSAVTSFEVVAYR